jgi:hypothetical protein
MGATFHFVEVMIRGREQGFDCVSVLRANGYPDAYGKGWLFSVIDKSIRNSLRDLQTRIPLGFRKDESELVTTVARGCIDATAMDAENPRQTTQCTVA